MLSGLACIFRENENPTSHVGLTKSLGKNTQSHFTLPRSIHFPGHEQEYMGLALPVDYTVILQYTSLTTYQCFHSAEPHNQSSKTYPNADFDPKIKTHRMKIPNHARLNATLTNNLRKRITL